jgi:hypothetical protein
MIPRRTRTGASLLLALALLSTGCVAKKVSSASPPALTPPASGGPGPSTGPVSAGPRPPCLRVRTPPSPPASEAEPLSGPIAKVADEVEQVRGLQFKRPVRAEAVSKAKIARLLQEGLDQGFPKEEADRTGQAWETMGLIPNGTDLRKAVVDFNSSQVIGFYDDDAQRLVIIGSSSLSPYQRFVLAHELTHALQDQNFGLSRLSDLDRTCQDERVEAFLALTEGDATETSVEWASQTLTAAEISEFDKEASDFEPPPASVPPFVQNLLVWPYGPGRSFVQALLSGGGQQALDQALEDPPRSTEQILHPEKFPTDAPTTVNVPNFGSGLGSGWKDLEFEDVGEGWFRLMLALREPENTTNAAAAGWDGGQYRAWTDGNGSTAVVMDTVWDTARDAREFGDAVTTWLGPGSGEVLGPTGKSVRVLFASDGSTLDRLKASVAG